SSRRRHKSSKRDWSSDVCSSDLLLTVCLVICLITVAGYIWGKYSLGTVACMSMILFLITGCITPQEALGNLSNSNVVLVLSMFEIGRASCRERWHGYVSARG